MSTIVRPFDPEAVKAADASLATKTGGRKLTMGAKDAALRKEWAGQYRKSIEEKQTRQATSPTPAAKAADVEVPPREMGSSMQACPLKKPEKNNPSMGWKKYEGDSRVFHCGYEGIKEDVTPNIETGRVQNECFYDEKGTLVDKKHPYAGCGGSPNQYDAAEKPWGHTWSDEGGIRKAGPEGLGTSVKKAFGDASIAVSKWTEEKWNSLGKLFK